MATGSTADFWAGKALPAVTKHEILRTYVPIFVAKLASTNSKVVLIDGYAGMGRYEDGQAGSAIQMILIAANLVATRNRVVDVYLVEQDHDTFLKLKTEVSEFLGLDRLNVFLIEGDISQHLIEILTMAKGSPAFIFLDPYGLGLEFDRLIHAITVHRPSSMKTEILLNFSADAVRRIGGLVPTPDSNVKALAKMDAVVGGDWWRAEYEGEFDKELAERNVVEGYLNRIARAAGMATFAVDAKRKMHNKAIYYLVFGTRHPDGVWFFAESVAKAAQKCRNELFLREEAARPTLTGMTQTPDELNLQLEASALEEIKSNILTLLETKASFIVGNYSEIVFGSFFGEVTEKVVRKAIKELSDEGKISQYVPGAVSRLEVKRPS